MSVKKAANEESHGAKFTESLQSAQPFSLAMGPKKFPHAAARD